MPSGGGTRRKLSVAPQTLIVENAPPDLKLSQPIPLPIAVSWKALQPLPPKQDQVRLDTREKAAPDPVRVPDVKVISLPDPAQHAPDALTIPKVNQLNAADAKAGESTGRGAADAGPGNAAAEEAARIRAATEEAARIRAAAEEGASIRAATEEAARIRAATEEAARIRAATEEAARIRAATEEAARVRCDGRSSPDPRCDGRNGQKRCRRCTWPRSGACTGASRDGRRPGSRGF